MKTFIPIIPMVAALSLFEEAARCEEPVGAMVLPPETAAMVQQATTSAQAIAADAARQTEAALGQFDQMGNAFGATLNPYQQMVQAAMSEVPPPPGYRDRLVSVVRKSSSGPGRTSALVVRFTDTDPTVQANLEEDLTVMQRILDKALEDERSSKTTRVMGIDVYFSPSRGPNRSMYLDGYGALFLVKVDFPLLPPPSAKDEPKEKPAVDSSWEEARRELYGQHGNGSDLFVAREEVEEYDADKIAKLKDSLLEALKSAANIRNLKTDDTITVCVFGGAGQRVIERKSSSTGSTGPREKSSSTVSIVNTPGRGSVLTVRAKKSDVDAFAKGKLNLDEFRKKVALTTYQGGVTDSWF